ncbi:MAG: AAA family ATPase [Minicystis sp.]
MPAVDRFGWLGAVVDGKYEMEAVAGEGQFGVVYRARHLGMNQLVAVKCLKTRAGLSENERADTLASLRHEAGVLSRLSSRTSGIAQAHDVGAAVSPRGDWTPYLVMEWLQGETLEDFLRRRRAAGAPPLGVAEAVTLLAPAARALALAHRAHIAHRDVKPSNLFLVKDGDDRLVKVVDFGIAKMVPDAPGEGALARTRVIPGAFTPLYGAPEQLQPRFGATGPWTDVFAMALVLVEVATGSRALRGSDERELEAAAIDDAERPSLTARGAAASAATEDVIQRALAVRPMLRFADLGEMWDALEGSLHTEAPGTRQVDFERVQTAPELPGVTAATSRICTVMMVDLSPVVDALAAEDAEQAAEHCLDVITRRVEEMDGFVERTLGNSAIAIFGAPRSSDNDAERAVLAALEIQADLARAPRARRARAGRPRPQIGIETGRVFAAAAPGTPRWKQTIRGDAVNVAKQLEQAADEGTIVIGRDTYRQVQRAFNVAQLALVRAGAGRDPVLAYRVLGRIPVRSALPSFDFYGVNTRVFGRAPEVARLLDELDAATVAGAARLVTLVGPPGVGRSRLLVELTDALALRREPFIVMAAQCSALAVDMSHALAAALLRGRFGIGEGASPPAIRRALRRGLRWFALRAQREGRTTLARDRAGPWIDEALAEIATILEPEVACVGGGAAMAPDVDHNPARDRVRAAAARLLGFVSARFPVVILCDDIQWADHASLDLLADLALRAANRPLLIVCSARPELYDRRPHWGEGRAAHVRMDVAPLAPGHVRQMIADRLRFAEEVPDSLVQRLLDLSDGNPLIVQETLHLLVDLGIIEARENGRWIVHEERVGEVAVPPTIGGVMQARLDRLPPELGLTLTRAAVVGRTFWKGAVDRLLALEGTRLSTARILDELRQRRLVHARETCSFPGERDYVFAEWAMRQVAYESLDVRRPLHRAVAAWLREQPGHVPPALLAHHDEEGDDPAQAFQSHIQAAREAASLGDDQGALRHFGRAVELSEPSAGDEDEGGERRDGEDRRVAPWRDRVRLHLERGDALRLQGRLAEAAAACEAARASILRVERRSGSPWSEVEAVTWDARVDYHLSLVLGLRGSIAEARAVVERAIARATEGGALSETPAMYAQLAFLLRRDRKREEAYAWVRKGLSVSRQLLPSERRRSETARLLLGVAAALYAYERWVSAERTYLQIARLVGDADLDILGRALNGVAATLVARGSRAQARDVFLRALEVKQRLGDLHQLAVAHSNLAEVALSLADVGAAFEHVREAVQLGEQTGTRSDLGDMYRNLADISLAAGQLGAALDAGQRALDAARDAGLVYLLQVGRTILATCARAATDPRLMERVVALALALGGALADHANDAELGRLRDEVEGLLAELEARRRGVEETTDDRS